MYSPEIEAVLAAMNKKTVMVLATAAHDVVTARSMSVLAVHDKIYFQTDTRMTKIVQIQENNRVALCADNFQICGSARLLGSWNENDALLAQFMVPHKAAYERYKHVATEIVVEVNITAIEMWEYRAGEPYLITIDLPKNKYTLTKYEE